MVTFKFIRNIFKPQSVKSKVSSIDPNVFKTKNLALLLVTHSVL
jgi:hypothetical protein